MGASESRETVNCLQIMPSNFLGNNRRRNDYRLRLPPEILADQDGSNYESMAKYHEVIRATRKVVLDTARIVAGTNQ